MEIKKYKKENEMSFALGGQITFNMLELRGSEANRVFVSSKQKHDETYSKIQEHCKRLGIPLTVNDKVFNILSDKENCYMIGEFRKYEQKLDKTKPHIVLVNPENGGNLGTILRSAVGFGITNIAIITPAVDLFDPKTIRASMGAVFACNVQHFQTFEEYAKIFKSHTYYPFMLTAKNSLKAVNKSKMFSLIFGAESSGLSSDFTKIGTPVKIEQTIMIDSFNLPIAVGIALYEFTNN